MLEVQFVSSWARGEYLGCAFFSLPALLYKRQLGKEFLKGFETYMSVWRSVDITMSETGEPS